VSTLVGIGVRTVFRWKTDRTPRFQAPVATGRLLSLTQPLQESA
jgi:hypothetical protein